MATALLLLRRESLNGATKMQSRLLCKVTVPMAAFHGARSGQSLVTSLLVHGAMEKTKFEEKEHAVENQWARKVCFLCKREKMQCMVHDGCSRCCPVTEIELVDLIMRPKD